MAASNCPTTADIVSESGHCSQWRCSVTELPSGYPGRYPARPSRRLLVEAASASGLRWHSHPSLCATESVESGRRTNRRGSALIVAQRSKRVHDLAIFLLLKINFQLPTIHSFCHSVFYWNFGETRNWTQILKTFFLKKSFKKPLPSNRFLQTAAYRVLTKLC